MTLDEAIQHAQEIADNGCDQCAKDHQQLANWLTELKNRREADPNLNLVKTFTNICELKVKPFGPLESVKPMQLPHIDMRLCSIYNIKDGDILYYNKDDDRWIFIFRDVNGIRNDMKRYHELQYYAFCFEGIKDFVELKNSCLVDITKIKFATDEQKQILYNALKAQGYKWDPENKKIIKIYGMTPDEIDVLLNKVKADINNYNSYHVWYSASSEEIWDEKGGYVTFEVYGHSDQGEGSNWTEYWSIDDNGTIARDGDIYENYNEFKNDWT